MLLYQRSLNLVLKWTVKQNPMNSLQVLCAVCSQPLALYIHSSFSLYVYYQYNIYTVVSVYMCTTSIIYTQQFQRVCNFGAKLLLLLLQTQRYPYLLDLFEHKNTSLDMQISKPVDTQGAITATRCTVIFTMFLVFTKCIDYCSPINFFKFH